MSTSSSETLTNTSTQSSLDFISHHEVSLNPLQTVDLSSLANGPLLRQYRDNMADVAASKTLRRDLSDLRSALPCLSQFGLVYYNYSDHFWLVYLDSLQGNLESIASVPLYVGQRPIYLTYGKLESSGRMVDVRGLDEIDPRAIISDGDLRLIQHQFPHAYGIRVHAWGFIDVLFRTPKALFAQRELPSPDRIGALGFTFIISEHWPTSHAPAEQSDRFKVGPQPSILPSTQTLRGKAYITTTSHTWVTRGGKLNRLKPKLLWKTYGPQVLQTKKRPRAESAAVHKKNPEPDSALRRPESPRRPSPFVKLGRFILERVLNCHRRSAGRKIPTPVGVTVYLKGSASPLGEITQTYDDRPPYTAKYLNHFPMGFKHDLSLIEAKEGGVLPRMVVPACHPSIHPRFAHPASALRLEEQEKTKPKQLPAFLMHPHSFEKTDSVGPESSKAVLINGVDYLFEGEHLQRSLIWRSEREDLSVVGMSGSALCLGNLADTQVQALLFQNFETPMSQSIYAAAKSAMEVNRILGPLVTYKGGFFLPEDVLHHGVIEVECALRSGPVCN
ncbi:hypothetical protein C8R43DRAFT_1164979 [Mycena crocata]|nr:hypothetical protein C8R43DRAFT_1164979 [Mycena crocata]